MMSHQTVLIEKDSASEILFSIVVTCYNQRYFIRAAVDSALSQRNPMKEVIVVDDASSDGSLHILEEYGDSIVLIRFPGNRGAIEARNHGAAQAKGSYLVFLDGDDLLAPWALDVYGKIIMQRDPNIILGSRLSFEGAIPAIRREDMAQRIEFVEYRNLMIKDRVVEMGASVFAVKRQAFQDVGGWSPGIFYLDLVDISMKLGCSGRTVQILSPVTGFYRLHAENSINSVPPFLRMAHHLMDKEKGGQYPGGPEQRFERYAWLGGPIFFWAKVAFQAGLYKDALLLVVSGSPMILAAIVRRSMVRIRGRRPVETLDVQFS